MIIAFAIGLVAVIVAGFVWIVKNTVKTVHKKEKKRAKTLDEICRDELKKW